MSNITKWRYCPCCKSLVPKIVPFTGLCGLCDWIIMQLDLLDVEAILDSKGVPNHSPEGENQPEVAKIANSGVLRGPDEGIS